VKAALSSAWAASAWAVLACAASVTPLAHANDRPLLVTTNAMVDEDNAGGSWAFESFWQRYGPVKALTVAPEYSFDESKSLQLLFTTYRERNAERPANTLEFEYKHVLNNIARDGYGIGWHLSFTTENASGKGLRSERLAVRGLYTLPLRDNDTLLHLNLGAGRSRGERGEWIGSVVLEQALPWRTHAFIELGREERTNLIHTGIRHWVKKERFAVDLSWQQQRVEGQRYSGLVLGFGWYDL